MKYSEALAVDLKHDYFLKGCGKGFRFLTAQGCENRLRKKGWVFRANRDGFRILADLDKMKENQDEPAFYLDVAAYSPDPCFAVYSNLDIERESGTVYYVNTWDKSVDGEKTHTPLTILNRSSGETKGGVPALLKPKQFGMDLEAVAGDEITLADRAERVIQEWTIESSGEPPALYFDRGQRPGGLFSLRKNGVIAARYYSEDKWFGEKPLFIFGMRLSAADVIKDGSPVMQAFEAQVANRPVYWRYNVFTSPNGSPSNGRNTEGITVLNNNAELLPGVTFDRQPGDGDSDKAVFQSNKRILMTEGVYKDIQLKEDGSETLLVADLPNAEISLVRYREGEWISDMFVYI